MRSFLFKVRARLFGVEVRPSSDVPDPASICFLDGIDRPLGQWAAGIWPWLESCWACVCGTRNRAYACRPALRAYSQGGDFLLPTLRRLPIFR